MTQKLGMLATVDQRGYMAWNGDMPLGADLPENQDYIWGLTHRLPVIMGWGTYQAFSKAFGDKRLGKETIILTHNGRGDFGENPEAPLTFAGSVEEALWVARERTGNAMVMGGLKVFEAFRTDVTDLYLTVLGWDGQGEMRPVPIQGGLDAWKLKTQTKVIHEDDNGEARYLFQHYERLARVLN